MTTRAGFPLNFNMAAANASLMEDFSAAGEWVDYGSAGSHSSTADTVNYKTGTQGLKLTQATSGTVKRRKYYSTGLDFSRADTFSLWVYSPYNCVSLQTITAYFSTGASANFSNAATVTLGAGITGTRTRGWNLWTWLKSDMSSTGAGVTWSNVNNIMFSFGANTNSDEVTLDSLSIGYRSKSKILFTLDDAVIDQYAAVQEANTYDIPCTLYVIAALMQSDGGSTYLSAEQARTLLAAGNDIGLHHQSFFDEVSDGGAACVEECRDYLKSINCVGPGLNHLAYPGGIFNGDILAAMAAHGVVTARTIRGRSYRSSPTVQYETIGSNDNQITSLGTANPLALQGVGLSNATTLAQMRAAVDKAIKYGATLIIYGHQFGASAGQDTWANADWTALLQYVAQKRMFGLVDCMTISQWYNGMVNGGRVSS